MIVGFLLQLLANFLSFILGLLPSSPVAGGGLPTDMVNAFALMVSYLKSFAFLFPIDTLLQVAILAVTFYLAIFAFKVINWVLNKLRGSGT